MDETQKYFVDFGDYLSPEIYKIIEKCANEIIDKICESMQTATKAVRSPTAPFASSAKSKLPIHIILANPQFLRWFRLTESNGQQPP